MAIGAKALNMRKSLKGGVCLNRFILVIIVEASEAKGIRIYLFALPRVVFKSFLWPLRLPIGWAIGRGLDPP